MFILTRRARVWRAGRLVMARGALQPLPGGEGREREAYEEE